MDTSKKGQAAKIFRRLLRYVKQYWPAFILAAIGNLTYAVVDSYSAYLFKPLLDRGFIGRDVHFLSLFPFIILGLFFARGVGGFVSTYAMGWVAKNTVFRFRRDLFSKLLGLPASFYDKATTGHILAVLTYNVDQVTRATSGSLTTLVRETATAIGLMVVMMITDWQLTLGIFIVLPLLIYVVRYVSLRFRKLSRRIQNSMGDITHAAEEAARGYKDIRMYGGQNQEKDSFFRVNSYNFKQGMKVVFMDAISTPTIQFIGACVLAGVVAWVFRGGKPSLSPGGFVTMLTAMLALLKPIKNLSKVNSSIQSGIAAAEGIFSFIDVPDEIDPGTKTLDGHVGHIEFKNLSFAYETSQASALNNLSLSLPTGKTTALVGHSGSGKSTLVNLLCGFYRPRSGEILFDGVAIDHIALAELRSHIAVVSQHVNLFNTTLRDNIAFGVNQDKTDAEIITAAKAAHAWEFIEQLPEGLDTLIGENGFNLSGGQRQRIAIARAILKDAPILILDEATSALDNRSERAVQAALEQLMQSRTTLVVAHRLSTIEAADQIAVLSEGQVVELGSHAELVQRNGIYKQLCQNMMNEN